MITDIDGPSIHDPLLHISFHQVMLIKEIYDVMPDIKLGALCLIRQGFMITGMEWALIRIMSGVLSSFQ